MAHEIWQTVCHDNPDQDFGDLVTQLESEVSRNQLAHSVGDRINDMIPPVLTRSFDIKIPLFRSREKVTPLVSQSGKDGKVTRVLAMISQALLVRNPQ